MLNAVSGTLWCKQDLVSTVVILRGAHLDQLQRVSQQLALELHEQTIAQIGVSVSIGLGQPVERVSAIIRTMRLERKVVVGHWQELDVQTSLGAWSRAAWADAQGARFARFGDNMREVAVTEGDKVNAQMRLGYSVNGYGVSELVRYVNEVSDSDVDALIDVYGDQYDVAPALRTGGAQHQSLRAGSIRAVKRCLARICLKSAQRSRRPRQRWKFIRLASVARLIRYASYSTQQPGQP